MRAVVVTVAGCVMLLSSAAHGLLGWPAMRSALDAVGAGDALSGALSAGWSWGTAAMVAFGLITLLAGARLRRGDRSGVPAVAVIAACYVVFGVLAFVTRRYNPHFLLFVATGLLAGLPLLGGRGGVGGSGTGG